MRNIILQYIINIIINRLSVRKCFIFFPDWMNRLSVIETASVIYALFGPESQVKQSLTHKTIEVLLREVSFKFDLGDENVEDVTFGEINKIFRDREHNVEPVSSVLNVEWSKIISARLPIDSSVTTAYRKPQPSYLSPLDSATHRRLSCAESRRFLPRLEMRSELPRNGRYRVSK
jgi:hypothetical protein